ncbi:MAG: PEP-CTERM sorting domain-containing protein, partial [Limnospira sp.]
MKIKCSSIVASTVLAAGLASMSATAALADNLFSDLAIGSQTSVSGNDDVDAIENLFKQEVIEGYSLDDYKVDSKSGSNSYFQIEQLSEGVGTLTFKDSSLANSTFAFVLKAGNSFDAYLFEG